MGKKGEENQEKEIVDIILIRQITEGRLFERKITRI